MQWKFSIREAFPTNSPRLAISLNFAFRNLYKSFMKSTRLISWIAITLGTIPYFTQKKGVDKMSC